MEKKGIERLEYKLTAENIDIISDKAVEYMESIGLERKKISRIRLTLEECLLYWMGQRQEGDEEYEAVLSYGRKMWKNTLSIEVKTGKPMNPYQSEAEGQGGYTAGLLVNMGLYPKYDYRNGTNIISLRFKKEADSPFKQLGVVIMFALTIGFTTKLVTPAKALEVILNEFVNPIYETFFNILGCIAGPMIFLSVAWGIYGIGDVATLSRIGKNIMGRYLSIVLACTAVGISYFTLLGPGTISREVDNVHTTGVLSLLLDIFPSNIVTPFADGNTLQIIFLAFVVGVVLLFLDKQTEAVVKAVEQFNYMVQFMMELISKIVPYFIFIVIVQIIWSESYTLIKDMGKMVIIFVPSAFLMVLIAVVATSIKFKVNPFKLIGKLGPGFFIALTTASSAASFDTIINTCDKQLGIDKSVSRFGVPLGFVMCKPTTGFIYVLFSLVFAKDYNVDCSIGWIITVVIVATVLSVATPPTPGSGAAAYTMLFTQLGIPVTAITVALAFDILADFILTACDTTIMQLCLTWITSRTGKHDIDILRN